MRTTAHSVYDTEHRGKAYRGQETSGLRDGSAVIEAPSDLKALFKSHPEANGIDIIRSSPKLTHYPLADRRTAVPALLASS